MTEVQMLFNSTLMIKGKAFKIVEVELYCHLDPYTHCDKQQLKFETFYFHRINCKGFKEGSFKGMDITFGNDTEHRAYLIRSIQDSDGEVIEGPCLVVQRILLAFGNTKKVKDFHEEYSRLNPTLSIRCESSGLYLMTSSHDEIIVESSPRVGLKYKAIEGYHCDTVIQYCMGSYRFSKKGINLKKQSSTIKMSRGLGYVNEKAAGAKLTPTALLEEQTTWHVSDIAKCYGCYRHHVSQALRI